MIDWDKVNLHMNRPVICTFDDHAMNGDPVKCSCVGYLGFTDDKHIKIISWDNQLKSQESRLANIEYFSILKSTVLEIYPLKITKKWG